MQIKEALAVLACPQCLGVLHAVPNSEQAEGLACAHCQCVYPIRNDIPVMLIDEAVSSLEWENGKRSQPRGK